MLYEKPRETEHRGSNTAEALKIDVQLQRVKANLRNCAKNHKLCKSDTSPIPARRVLDLSSSSTGIVRLIEASGIVKPYVALSHCWGPSSRHPLMTTHATLDEHTTGIALSSLPQSFRDAIRVCTWIDIQYIWIDCLCIVQDDGDDWLAEAEKMAEIYSKSYLTIAASRAQNSHDGFLFDFPDDIIHYKVTVENPWDLYSQPEAFQASFRIDHETSERKSTPLNKRAWCLQEWYLPVRMAEFHLHDVKFLCEEGGLSRFRTLTDKGTWSRITLRGSGPNRDKELETLWETIRDDYFERALTKKSDMLPAIAGLAKRFQSLRKHSTYLAGLWSHNIAEGLSWTALNFDDGKTEVNEGVPSWSWASITYAVRIIGKRNFLIVNCFLSRDDKICMLP
ncbi:heterokaryon incompatibility protein-domain-containing protein [Rhexocercosporidium sp. MPI-PUGE-AT-0058]|nr:heterokaryon incompatibility protein-domain-containing protein [Rhexocercosporidium sp. MPI-PUGE-AT-0058]